MGWKGREGRDERVRTEKRRMSVQKSGAEAWSVWAVCVRTRAGQGACAGWDARDGRRINPA